MKVLRGTLTFVLGMVIGIILFVLAIGGTVVILATQMTVGDIQKSISGTEVIAPDSEIYNKSILEAVQGVISDVQNFDTLSLKTLYEHYGISLLNGISGIDFTDKEFYSVPIPDLINDLSIVVNSFTLNDISKIAGVDFAEYNLPILTDNLDNSISSAVDNILGSLNGDLSIRAIKDNFGIDLGVNDNEMLASLQDVNVSSFGSVINVLRVNALLSADTDTFILRSSNEFFVQTDAYEQVSAADLANKNYIAPIGVETYLAGGKDTDGDGSSDVADMRELRFIKKIDVFDGVETEKFVVDNSCYSENFDLENNEKVFYRHIQYAPAENLDGELFVQSYANRIESFHGSEYTLVSKGFIPIADLDIANGGIWGIEEIADKNSKLEETDASLQKTYTRVHEGTSTPILQTIAHMTIAELRDADSLLDGLTVGDIIEVNDDTAKIIRSLVVRNCKIKELGSVAGDMPLGEIIDITSSGYIENANGRYVRFIDENSYTLYDDSMQGLQRYKKNKDGSFSPDDKGTFVHSYYYTLYNPAEHTGMTRYDRLESDNASSQILQRFAGATLDGFSSAFDNLMLADVMEIDPDIYAVVDSEYMDSHQDERFFRYDSENRVYRVTNTEYRTEHPDETYYRITSSGESTSFLKKLAYVNVDGMSGAMEIILDDMMLSEILDVYSVSALILTSPSETSFNENSEYFIEHDVNNGYSGMDENGEFVFVYDSVGKYVRSNFKFELLPTSDISNNIKIYYSYKSYSDLWDDCNGDAEVFAEQAAELTSCGNLYYLDKDTNEYRRNIVLCTYMLGYTEFEQNGQGIPTATFPYRGEVFFRVAVDATEADGETVFEGIMQTLSDGAQAPEYGLFIKDDFRGFIEYDSTNPAFADKPLGTFIKSTISTENSLEYFILKDDVPFYASALENFDFAANTSLRYDIRRCETVYVKSADGNFVFVDGQYVEYDEQIHGDSEERFVQKVGYIAKSGETYYTVGNQESGVKVSEFNPQAVEYIHKKSVPVLRLLASGTLSEMTNVISDATVGDLIEAAPSTLFDIKELRESKISEIGTVFSSLLSSMTIGNLIQWSNVVDVNTYVRIALDSVSVNSLLHSLEYDATSGTIVVNMLKLYGYTD